MEDKQHKVPRYVEWSWRGALTGTAVGTAVGMLLSPGSQLRNPPLLGATVGATGEVIHQRSLDVPVYSDEMFLAVIKGGFVFWALDQLGLDNNLVALVTSSAVVGGLKINVYDESK